MTAAVYHNHDVKFPRITKVDGMGRESGAPEPFLELLAYWQYVSAITSLRQTRIFTRIYGECSQTPHPIVN